jgi:hypothetical protein
MGWEAWYVTIIKSFDPFGWEVEACPDGQLKVGEAHVFNIPFRFLVVCPLVLGNFISKSSKLLTKLVFHLTVCGFVVLDSFEESLANSSQGDSINVISDGIEGCGDCAGW